MRGAARWASGRLAPVQVVTWGHPVTSGLPSVDYFVSSALFDDEPRRFSEQLVAFDSTSFVFPHPLEQPADNPELRALVASGVKIVACPQVPLVLCRPTPRGSMRFRTNELKLSLHRRL